MQQLKSNYIRAFLLLSGCKFLLVALFIITHPSLADFLGQLYS